MIKNIVRHILYVYDLYICVLFTYVYLTNLVMTDKRRIISRICFNDFDTNSVFAFTRFRNWARHTGIHNKVGRMNNIGFEKKDVK